MIKFIKKIKERKEREQKVSRTFSKYCNIFNGINARYYNIEFNISNESKENFKKLFIELQTLNKYNLLSDKHFDIVIKYYNEFKYKILGEKC